MTDITKDEMLELSTVSHPLRVAVQDVPRPQTVSVYPGCVLVAPPGHTIHSVTEALEQAEQALPRPSRRRGIYQAANVNSLMRWMRDHCPKDAPVFATGAEKLAEEWKSPDLTLVGMGNYSKGDQAEWHDFGVQYTFPVTKAWKEWAAASKRWMSQAEFSEFVEGHLYEFSAPESKEFLSEATTRMIEALGGAKSAVASPNKMYELANGIKILVKEQVEVSLDRASGEASLHFTEEHAGKGGRPIAIPKFFYIRLPIFFGEYSSLIGVLLRYRNAGGGQVTWQYELFAPDLVVKDAFDKACGGVVTTPYGARTLYMGTPDYPLE